MNWLLSVPFLLAGVQMPLLPGIHSAELQLQLPGQELQQARGPQDPVVQGDPGDGDLAGLDMRQP